MPATLGDILLVFLADHPCTAHELQKRYVETFGPAPAPDVTRVMAVLTRQERSGLLRTEVTRASQRSFVTTEAGHRRQRLWLLGVHPETDPDDILTRVLLAIAATDRPTFDIVTGSCLAALEVERLRAPAGHRAPPLSAESARQELDEATAAALLQWLSRIRGQPRARDRS